MPSIRPTTIRNWQITDDEFYIALHYANMYEMWKDELENIAGLSAVQLDGIPHGTTTGDPTAAKAAKVAGIRSKMAVVEKTVREADPEIYKWLLRGVTRKNTTYNYLRQVMGIPCGKNQYYNARRKFYYLLSKKIRFVNIGDSEDNN